MRSCSVRQRPGRNKRSRRSGRASLLIQVGSEKKTRLRGGSKFSPNLRSTDRALLPGRAMIHLGIIEFLCGKALKSRCKSRRYSNLRCACESCCADCFSCFAHRFCNTIHPGCYSTTVGAGHFCPPLTVTRKIRLCLHPGGMLRVQSLHLPWWGLARRDLLKTFYQSKTNAVNLNKQ